MIHCHLGAKCEFHIPDAPIAKNYPATVYCYDNKLSSHILPYHSMWQYQVYLCIARARETC